MTPLLSNVLLSSQNTGVTRDHQLTAANSKQILPRVNNQRQITQDAGVKRAGQQTADTNKHVDTQVSKPSQTTQHIATPTGIKSKPTEANHSESVVKSPVVKKGSKTDR